MFLWTGPPWVRFECEKFYTDPKKVAESTDHDLYMVLHTQFFIRVFLSDEREDEKTNRFWWMCFWKPIHGELDLSGRNLRLIKKSSRIDRARPVDSPTYSVFSESPSGLRDLSLKKKFFLDIRIFFLIARFFDDFQIFFLRIERWIRPSSDKNLVTWHVYRGLWVHCRHVKCPRGAENCQKPFGEFWSPWSRLDPQWAENLEIPQSKKTFLYVFSVRIQNTNFR